MIVRATGEYLAAIGATTSVWGALAASEFTAWAGALVALAGAAYSVYRSVRRDSRDDARHEVAMKAIDQMNLAAIREGRRIPLSAVPLLATQTQGLI